MSLRSLQGQMMLAIAVALLIAQGLSAVLIWHEVHQRHIAALVNGAAMRMAMATDPNGVPPPPPGDGDHHGDGRHDRRGPPPSGADDTLRLPRAVRLHYDTASPQQSGDVALNDIEVALRDALVAQGENPGALVVAQRDAANDPLVRPILPELRIRNRLGANEPLPALVIAAERQPDGRWLTVRSFMPTNETSVLLRLLRQTVLTYLVLVTVVGLILRRITRPLRALTARLDAFAAAPALGGQLAPQGPADMRRLIDAHNAMETRLIALLDEKDVMLGAIGHDLKTPLAALRVRIEAVDNDAERARMATTIEEITLTLDDILSLARVGRPDDPVEATELSALVADVIGEYEDLGEDVTLADMVRMVAPVRALWLRRALRNLVSNALRYGQRARVALEREGAFAVLVIEDDGPGIPEHDLQRMLEPFTRLDPSRNSGTGGAGLGLTLARAIADQHGGKLTLANRHADGRVVGLVARLSVPLAG
jgi:signal transduction histidine kinase